MSTESVAQSKKIENTICYEVIKLIDELSPFKIFFDSPRNLEKVIEQLINTAVNEPFSSRQYAKLCHDIVLQLPNKEFWTPLVSIMQQKFTSAFTEKNLPMNIRFGTVRFICELYNFNILTDSIIKHILNMILSHIPPLQLFHYQVMDEIIEIAGWKLNKTDPAAMKTFKEKLEKVSVEQAHHLCLEARQLALKLIIMKEEKLVNPSNVTMSYSDALKM